jgi:YfiH family protein
VVCTGWAQGDMAGAGPAADRRRRAVVDRPWTVLRQVHGARVVTVDQPGGCAGEPADGAVTASGGNVLAVLTADCAPVVLTSPEGLVGVAHAGWKGLRAGVVEATVQSMRRMGATRVEAVLGPCIRPCCYTFGDEELMEMESRLGRHLRATDREGRPALDLPAGVRAAVHAAGATMVGEAGTCTGCTEGLWSWRTGRTARRQATVVWRP